MSIILKIENISKQYRLGLVGTGTLGHDLNRFWHRIRRKEDPYLKVGAVSDRSAKATEDYVWALRDINFEVNQGEVLGIIGKNGAGKSTLLKLLSRVTSPTTGIIKSRGRIASLLEVGTGFHPELTGRENIYLNGAILGMTRAEIASKIDEIIDFSGCELYIDTPTKRYSSGMTVRLAFAVAAHLEPDILVIDEVLAVGDAEFQKKAIGKMQNISKEDGRTVLFVSHNMAAVKSLCTRALVLENGETAFEGETDNAVDFYLKQGSSKNIRNYKVFSDKDKVVTDEIAPLSIGVKAKGKTFNDLIQANDEIEFIIEFDKKKKDVRIDTTLQIKNSQGNFILVTGSGMTDAINNVGVDGKITHTVSFQPVFFDSEEFYINILFTENNRNVNLKIDDAISFLVINEKSRLGTWMGKSKAPLKIKLDWKNIKNV
jgi:homopolymeric O-antigen transport system ATP-binding protein